MSIKVSHNTITHFVIKVHPLREKKTGDKCFFITSQNQYTGREYRTEVQRGDSFKIGSEMAWWLRSNDEVEAVHAELTKDLNG